MVAVAGIPGEACEYGLDNHYATPSHESHMSRAPPPLTNSHYNTAPIVSSKLGVSTMAWPNPGALPIVAAVYKASSLLNGKDKGYINDDLITNGNSSAHMRDSSHYQQSGFQLWKCLKTACECVCLFEKMLLLVLIVDARKVKGDLYRSFDNECVDSGGSSSTSNQSSGGGSSSSGSGSGKKQQNTNSNRSGSSSSSSQRSGSGSSQRGVGGGGTGMGGGRTLSGSSDDSSDDGDDDHNKRPRQQLNKEPKSKPDFDDEDDEETDSADEGGEDQSPREMTVDMSSPLSVHNDNGGSVSSHGVGLGVGEGGGEGKGQEGRRGRNNICSLPLLGSSGSGTNSNRFSTASMSGGATVESITLKEGMAGSSRITLVSSTQINSPVNMAVGYGVPVLAATDSDGLMATTAAVGAASSSSVPSSELGTPTQDSPPPHLGGRDTPGTPQAMSPEISTNPQVRQFNMNMHGIVEFPRALYLNICEPCASLNHEIFIFLGLPRT